MGTAWGGRRYLRERAALTVEACAREEWDSDPERPGDLSPMHKERLFWLGLVAILLVFTECTAYLAVKWVQSTTKRVRMAGIFWDGSHHSNEKIEAAFSSRDDLLGWPMAEQVPSPHYDSNGARPTPAFVDGTEACVAAFGDSFTYGNDVSHEDAWTNRLTESLECGVVNYGVPGYGLDQVYLRYQQKRADIASTSAVVIGFFPENIMRHVNQYVGFRVGRPNLLFKPRFVLEDGRLRLHPILSRERFDEKKLNENPTEILPHEFFLPGSRYGPVLAGFPYSFTALRALMHPRVIAVIRGRPSWIEFYEENSAGSEALDLTERLIETFVQDIESSGKTALVFVFTNANSVRTYLRRGTWPYQTVLDFMAENGIPHLHIGPRLAVTYGEEDICSVFTQQKLFGCTGHYTPQGYAIVAEMIADRLRAEGLFPSREATSRLHPEKLLE
jgi:hypothetical protein